MSDQLSNRSFLLPPHLDMDSYEDFVAASLAETDPQAAARQKALEEQIEAPFRFRPGPLISGF